MKIKRMFIRGGIKLSVFRARGARLFSVPIFGSLKGKSAIFFAKSKAVKDAISIRVGQFLKVSFTPSLIDGVFHADSKNGLFSCLWQAINLHSGFKVWPFFQGFRKNRLDTTVL